MSPPTTEAHFTMPAALISLSNSNLTIKGVPLLTQVPNNVTFSPFSSVCQSSQAPLNLIQRVQSQSPSNGFLGFTHPISSHLLKNSLGQFSNRPFLSVFRFKIWMSTMWVGSNGSDLQMETQWILFQLHELNSYVIIIPLIEGLFRSALHPGQDNQVMIWAESGSAQVQASAFKAIAYVHFGDNPFSLMKEAFTAVRVHLDTCRLLEEKSAPPLVDRFGWCTWDAFYLSVEPVGIWSGVKEFYDNGLPIRFLIIDDGWQSIAFDDAGIVENLILGGEQMLGRLYRFEECDKFKKYKAGSLLRLNSPSYDPKRQKMIISKALEKEGAEKARDKAIRARNTTGLDFSGLESKIKALQIELNEICNKGEGVVDCESVRDGECCGSGLKAFTTDLRKRFPELNDVYVWHALCGAWGGLRPGATGLDSDIVYAKLSEGLEGCMEDLATIKMVESGIGLVHPKQAKDLYDAMHSYMAKAGITGVKVDDIHVCLSITSLLLDLVHYEL